MSDRAAGVKGGFAERRGGDHRGHGGGHGGWRHENRHDIGTAPCSVGRMRIAVISDTHDRYPPGLPALLRGADEIWHLGDVCAPETLAELVPSGVPLQVVRGNCDDWPAWPLTLDLRRGGVVFHLVHIPPRRAPAGVKVLLHGHTHVPADVVDEAGVRRLNPGSVSLPRAGVRSFAWLNVDAGHFRWTPVELREGV